MPEVTCGQCGTPHSRDEYDAVSRPVGSKANPHSFERCGHIAEPVVIR